MTDPDMISTLRTLILRASPDERMARPVATCGKDELLDSLIPFSSIIVLGVIVAIEDEFHIRVTREDLEETLTQGTTLENLARVVRSIQRRTNEN